MQHLLVQRVVAEAHGAIFKVNGAAIVLEMHAVRSAAGSVEAFDGECGQGRVAGQEIRVRQSRDARANDHDVVFVFV